MATRVENNDFAGEWTLTGNDKMEELLTAVGMSWIKRKAGSAIGYGVGRVKQSVSQDGDVITVDQKGGQKDFVSIVKADGMAAQTDSPDGVVPVTATWALDGSLVMQTEFMGCKVTVTRRRIDNKTTVMEIDTGKVLAKRTFTKQ
jgi:hypothetical protein